MAAPDQSAPAFPPAGKSPAVSRPSNLDLPGESLSGLRRLVGREKSKGTFGSVKLRQPIKSIKSVYQSLGSMRQFEEEAEKAATETSLEETAAEQIRYEDEMERKRQAYADMVSSGREARGLQGQTRTPEENERLANLNKSQKTYRKEAFGSKPLPAALSRTSMFEEMANRTDQKTNNEQQSGQQLQQQQQQKRLEQKKSELSGSGGIEEQKQKAQEEVRKQMKAAVRRGVEEAAQGAGNALDLGTGGISTVVTVLMYAVTLVDLNLQMIWGYYITKKKSFFFPALEWSPLPVGNFISVKFLHIGLVTLDLLVLILLIVGFSMITVIMLLPLIFVVGEWAIMAGLIFDPGFRAQILSMMAQIAFKISP